MSLDDYPRGFACVVGAPRCGTTSLSRYLARHPQICFASVKEPHFFAQSDLSDLPEAELRDLVEHEYLERFFAHCADRDAVMMEGSVSYLYAAERMQAILRLWPQAKFIIALRDPLRMIPSLHQRLLYTGDETEADFARAWRLIGARRAGRKIPRTCLDPRLLDYEEIGRLGKHVAAFFAAVGRERCHIVIHDDLVADPGAAYRGVLAFLGLPDDGRRKFGAKRAGQGFKLGWLQRALKRPPERTRTLLAGKQFRQRVKSLDGKKAKAGPSPLAEAILGLRKRLLRWNKAPAEPIRVPPDLRAEIRDTLAADIDQLGTLIGRDLGHWLGRRG
ncbi:sulfotransferase [Sphingomonas sp.]|uniref:sulfotransferase family protein n=1 Tax=Sphingomonas sp. TaxID=28214 RepID=UPI00286E593C|nr:sulfotransferase [Sphingomonas sp.]